MSGFPEGIVRSPLTHTPFLSPSLAASRPGEYRDIFPSYVTAADSSDTTGAVGAIRPSPYDWQLSPRNGSLILAAASPAKSGRYLCHVANGIGQELDQVVNFTVKAPPRIVAPPGSSLGEERAGGGGEGTQFVSTSVGVRSTRLECEARGDRPITVTWTKVRDTFIACPSTT